MIHMRFRRMAAISATAVILLAMHGRVSAADKPMFSADELSRLDKTLTDANDPAKVSVERAKIGRELAEIFSTKAMSELWSQVREEISKGDTKKKFAVDKATRDQRLRESLGEERLRLIRSFYQAGLQSKDLSVKRSAMWWILSIDPDAAADSKVIALLSSKDADTRFEAARQLAELRKNPAGEKVLAEALASRQMSKSLQAADALSRIGSESARTKALEVYRSTQTHAVFRAGAVSILGNYDNADINQVLVEALSDSSPQVVGAAVGELRSRNSALDDRAIGRLFEIVDDKRTDRSHKMMTAGLIADAQRIRKSAIDVRSEFLKRLNSVDVGIRNAAVNGLVRVGTKKDVRRLIPLLDDKDEALKLYVERALGKITGIRFESGAADINSMIQKRKDWWAQHSGDKEYR